jgi:hypothetical protein
VRRLTVKDARIRATSNPNFLEDKRIELRQSRTKFDAATDRDVEMMGCPVGGLPSPSETCGR